MFGLQIIRKSALENLREENTIYQRTLEDLGWINLSQDNSSAQPFIGEGFKKMLRLCKTYYYRNPLAGHWVHLTTAFVFGEGVGVPKAKDEKIQEVVKAFWENKDNQLSMTGFQAQQLLCNKLQYEGNLFFVLFSDDKGDVRVRILNTEEVEDIIKDTEDRMRANFYKICYKEQKYNFAGDNYNVSLQKYMYYPDWSNFNIEDFGVPPEKLSEAVIFHVKINCDINDKFGVPELYRGIDWIKAHKDMASDLATLVKSLSTLAWKKKVKGTPAQVATLKAAMNAKTDMSNKGVSAGSTQYENEGVDTSPINTPMGGAVIGEKGLKQMQLMVCAASGLFYHYFGDPETGNLATTTSMELPMIKKFSIYQALWQSIYRDILDYQIFRKIEVGLLSGKTEYDEKTRRMIVTPEGDSFIDIDFPPIIDKDPKVLAEALDIGKRNNLISDESAARLFLMAVKINNVDEEIKDIDFTRVNNPFGGILGPDGQPIKPLDKEGKPIEDKDKKKDEIPPKDKKKEEEPLKEGIDTPLPQPGARFARKGNYVLQRMNGYRKALAGNYSDFRKNMRESMKSTGTLGMIVGHVVDYDKHLANLKKDMLKSAATYFPIAIDIGQKFTQSHLKAIQVQESIYEANSKGKSLLKDKLDWNEKYITESLIPDIEKAIVASLRISHGTHEDFLKSMNAVVDSFDGRVEQYSGAFWRVEEAAVKEAGEGTGLMVNFVGADDESTCEGCNEAMAGNPYPIDECPEPGEHECNGRCRHAIQIIE